MTSLDIDLVQIEKAMRDPIASTKTCDKALLPFCMLVKSKTLDATKHGPTREHFYLYSLTNGVHMKNIRPAGIKSFDMYRTFVKSENQAFKSMIIDGPCKINFKRIGNYFHFEILKEVETKVKVDRGVCVKAIPAEVSNGKN